MAAEQPLRLLQLGLGARGRTWARIVRESTQAIPVAYVDPRPEARGWAGTQSVPVFANLHAAVRAVQADAALVVTPPAGRCEIVEALLAAGLHVLAEKPLALDLEGAAAMTRAAAQAGRQLGVVQNFRYMPVTAHLRERVRSRRYGAPMFATLLYIRNRDGRAPHLNKYPLEMDQPMLLEQSIHHLDLLRYVYQSEAEDVACQTWNPPGSMYHGDACAAALIRLRGGPVVVYHGTWVSGSRAMTFEWRTDFERGVVIQRDLFGDVVEGAIDDADLRPVPIEASEPFITDSRLLLEDFLQACRHGRAFPASGDDHLRTLALTLACIESSRTGRRVSPAAYPAYRGQV